MLLIIDHIVDTRSACISMEVMSRFTFQVGKETTEVKVTADSCVSEEVGVL